ncbi:uncharacterized protein LOC26529330 isoform X3 [Drosophila willistoni]|nr:uncharacterized protein LOC26529330 isoform X3 [Drosophila willistoni]
MMSAFEGKKAAASSMEHLQFVANVLAILQLQIRKFPSTDTNLLLNKLWSLCLSGDQVHPLAGQIIFTFSDDLAHRVGSSPEMQKVIQHLVQSKEKTDRKTGYSLMRKLKEYVDPNYISALEHLEEQQMPNNLVSLLDKLKSTTDISPWTRILYLKLFHSENELVLYETVKYIANNLTISHLTDWNLIDEFLAATNGTIFHDDIEVFKNFVFSSGVESIVEALVNVPWKWNNVSLWNWLRCIPKEKKGQSPCISKEILLKFAFRFQEMTNVIVLEDSLSFVMDRFCVTIDKLSLRDYLFFIETMYKNLMVKYWDHDSLLDKIKNCDNFGAEIVFFNKISLDVIFLTQYYSQLANALIATLIEKLKTVPKAQRGLLPYYIMVWITDSGKIRDFCATKYEVNISLILDGDLKQIQKHLLDKLMWQTEEEKSILLKTSVDLFVLYQIKKWKDIKSFGFKPQELLQMGGKRTFQYLGNLLEEVDERLEDANVLSTFVSLLKKFPFPQIAECIGKYASKHLTPEEQNRISSKIISYHIRSNRNVVTELLKSDVQFSINKILEELILHLEIIEDGWIFEAIVDFYYTVKNRNKIISEFMQFNNELSESHPRYLANSKEHTLKFCIASALMSIDGKYECLDLLWTALLSPHEQLNITCLYEVLVAKHLEYPQILIERLQSIATLQPNQQMSLLSVTHWLLNNNSENWNDHIDEFLQCLVPLTEAENLEVRQFTTLIIQKLFTEYISSGNGHLNESIQKILKDQIANESVLPHVKVRLLLPKWIGNHWTKHNFWFAFTMENRVVRYNNKENEKIVHEFRKAFKSTSIHPGGVPPVNEDMPSIKQINDTYPKSNLTCWNTSAASEPGVVPLVRGTSSSQSDGELIVLSTRNHNEASLNDLMETCNAFGVRTLVLNKLTNLGIRAAGELTIWLKEPESLHEYLREKKMKNYKIVGIENMERSYKLASSQKTILVLGEDQQGTADNLKDLLDSTIVLPLTDVKNLQNMAIYLCSQPGPEM